MTERAAEILKEIALIVRSCIIIASVVLIVWTLLSLWANRYELRTANGRFYRHDRWTFRTLVVDKDGTTHSLREP